MRKRSSFTLVEVLIVIIVLAILAAIAIPIYQNRVEQVRIDICTANQEALLEAVKIYEMKYDVMPGSLAKVWHKYGEEALVIVWNRKKNERDYIYLAYMSFQKFKYFPANIFSINPLYAQPSFRSTLADRSVLNCPSAGSGGYGINGDVAGQSWDDIIGSPEIELIIADVNNADNSLAYRHRQQGASWTILTYEDNVSALEREDGVVEAVNVEDNLRVVGRGNQDWHSARRAAEDDL